MPGTQKLLQVACEHQAIIDRAHPDGKADGAVRHVRILPL